MIGDAIDTAVTLGWALAAWIAVLALAAGLALHTIIAVVWWAGRTAWTLIRRAYRYAAISGAHSPPGDSRDATAPHSPADARLRPPPSWATNTEEAA